MRNRRALFRLPSPLPSSGPPFPDIWLVMASVLLLTLSIPFILLLLAAFVDHNLIIEGGGVGILEDWNILAMFATFPLELLLLHLAWRRIHRYTEEIPRLTTSANTDRLRESLASAVLLASKWPLTLRCFRTAAVTLSWAFLVINAANRYFAYGVIYFDPFWTSSEFPLSYWVTNAYTALVWGLLTPYCITKIAQMIWFIKRINTAVLLDSTVQLLPLAPDGIGGLQSLGRLALLMSFMALPLQVHLVIYRLWIPHGNPPFFAGASAALVITTLLFIVPVTMTHRTLARLRERGLQEIADRFNVLYRATMRFDPSGDSPFDQVSEGLATFGDLYQFASRIRTWPVDIQVLGAFVAVVVVPLATVVIPVILER